MPVAPTASPRLRVATGAGPSSSPGGWRAAAVPVLVAAAAVAAIVAFDPVHRDVPLCPLHAVTGLWCPFCGGLRAVWLLAHLQIGAALSSNLVLVVLAPWLAWKWWRGITGRPPFVPHLQGRSLPPAVITTAVVVLLVAYTVVRNLPVGAMYAPAG